MGVAKDLVDAAANSPAVPKVGVFAPPCDYIDLSGKAVQGKNMDLCVRVLSIFKCHKACPLTAACAVGVAALLPGSILEPLDISSAAVRVGHPSGVMTVYSELSGQGGNGAVRSVAVQRTARRIIVGTVYIRE